jgi:SAM-dependent methyltransferase
MDSSPIQLRIGTDKEFAVCREFFRQSSFTDAAICELLKLDDMSSLGRVEWEKLERGASAPAAWACLQLFVRGAIYPKGEFLPACGENVYAALTSLGLVRPTRANPEDLICPVWLYPADGFVIASDRRDHPEETLLAAADDVVFPAIYAGTLRFLKLLPDAKGGRALDHCGGTGIGALHLARTAQSAASADLTARSAFFAEFNGRLNGVPIESLCGDLYEPAADRTFDIIAGHPPFVPATGPTMIYRDAGEAGEDVTRRLIEGIPQHLRPGGKCVVLCVARDTNQAPFETRVREWLGEAHSYSILCTAWKKS